MPLTMRGAITYVDATTENTALPQNVQLVNGVNYTAGPDEVVSNGVWHLFTGVGNGANGIWTAKGSPLARRSVDSLITALHLPEPGGYRIYGYIWAGEDAGADWAARFRVGTNSSPVVVLASDLQPADPARFNTRIITAESSRKLFQVPLGIVMISAPGDIQIFLDDKTGLNRSRTWYDGLGYERVFKSRGQREIGIDFNKSDLPGAPSQAMFRIIEGASKASQNQTHYEKKVGSYRVEVSKTSRENFEFRGANGDATRVISGGPTSLSFLVSDFIGSRDGTINLKISGLPTGVFLFRSYHLEPLDSGKLGFAQGATSLTPNTLRAHVNGTLEAITQPTSVGSIGLNTTFISDADIPVLSFPFTSDGTNPIIIKLSTTLKNAGNQYIFLNGFEVFATTP